MFVNEWSWVKSWPLQLFLRMYPVSFEYIKKKLFRYVLSKVAALYGGLKVADILNLPKASSFHHEYSSMACTVEIIQDVYGAIDHIHRHGRYVLKCFVMVVLCPGRSIYIYSYTMTWFTSSA